MVQKKNIGTLAAGERFNAQIMDIHQNQVTLKLAGSGHIFNARSLVLPDARIGDMSTFLVKENNRGQIMLEMVKPFGDSRQQAAAEALSHTGLMATEENVKKVLFLLEENFPINESQVAALNRFLSRTCPIHQCFEKLLSAIEGMPDETQQTLLLNCLSDGQQQTTQAIRESFYVNLLQKGDNRPAMHRFLFGHYKSWLVKLESLLKALETLPSPPAIAEHALLMKEQMLFMAHISRYRRVAHIPFQVEGNKTLGELVVFKNPEVPHRQKDCSLMIGVDTLQLGRMEAFITRQAQLLTIQFKMAETKHLAFIEAQCQHLAEILRPLGFQTHILPPVPIETPFSLIDRNIPTINGEKSKKSQKRYSFDMRV